ncbi:MAG: DUF4383 domain-containing protein [Gammaproteobacteria bacterium]
MNNLAVTVAWTLAALFLGTAILGFIPNPLLGQNAFFVTNTAHDFVHLASAIGFAVVAVLGEKVSIRFMQAFGIFHVLIGLIGLMTLNSQIEGYLFNIIHINSFDNFLHLGSGILIVAAGWILRSYQHRFIFANRTAF